MQHSRREFVGAGLAGAASLYAARTLGAADLWNIPQQSPLANEDGYRLWLRYVPLPGAPAYRRSLGQLVIEGSSPTATVIRREMSAALSSMLGAALPDASDGLRDGAIVVGTPDNSPAIKGLGWQSELAKMGAEGYLIRPARVASRPVIAIASAGEIGALYGAFHFLRLLQTGAADRQAGHRRAAESAAPAPQSLGQPRRHDRARLRGPLAVAVERAARHDQPAYIDYARANASDRHQRRGRSTTSTPTCGSSRRSTSRRSRRSPTSWRPVRRPHVPLGECRRADAARRAHDRRSARSGRRRLVEGEGRRDLQAHSGLRRLSRESQLRRAARPEGLRPDPCRRRQRAGRRAGAAWRQRHLARVHLRRRRGSGSREAGVHRVHEARRAVPAERRSCRSRTARSTSCRASRSIRCSAR